MKFLRNLLGSSEERLLRPYQQKVAQINALEESIQTLSNEELKAKTIELKGLLTSGKTLEEILPEAFALVREAAKRTLGQRHFDVQLIGGMLLHDRKIAEMRTGEGKTLVATLPAYLNALEGKGVHVVTVNDYLSRRDAVWMGQIYSLLGLSVGVINHDSTYIYDATHTELDSARDEVASFKVIHEFLRPVTRQEGYEADITYGTNSEFGFDYLRDNIEYEYGQVRQKNYAFAIVDEIDSILIDEARTPLIISAPTTEGENLYSIFASIADTLEIDVDYVVNEKFRSATLTDEGITKAEKKLGVDNIYTDKGIKYVHHLETAVRAKALFIKDKEYVVKNGEVIIVDEFTGRLQPGRRWSEGLHQAVEAKEGVPVQKESRTYASITYQNYFRLYKKLSGMTGTASTSAEEFRKVYRLDTIAVPTNKPIAREDRNDFIFQTEQGKFIAIARTIKELNAKGQPVLIGTASIEKNELLSAYLTRSGITHQMLNAKNHEREGEIIALAGKKGSVTIATNMAGRGVDIKLGGPQSTKEEAEEIKNLGGLFVLGTERHEARRIDNQLRGRSGRQGDPGTTQFFVSLEDTLMRVFATDMIKKMMGKLGVKEDEPIENYLITRSLESAQTRIEGMHFDARKHVLEYDDVLNFQRKTIYDRRRVILKGEIDDIKASLTDILAGDLDIEKIVAERVSLIGESEFYNGVKRLLLQSIDMHWVDHLEAMDYLRSSVSLRSIGQRDPLVEYKKEGLHLFKDMQESIRHNVMSLIPNIGAGAFVKEEAQMKETVKNIQLIGGGEEEKSTQPILNGDQPGRNDPCMCGSGKKWKKCGELNTEEHQKRMAEKK